MRHFIIFFSMLFINLHQSYGMDKDEFITKLYEDLYRGNYNHLKEIADTAIDAWERRVQRAQQVNSPWRRSGDHEAVSPQDDIAAKNGKQFCENTLAYWRQRLKNINALYAFMTYYTDNILPILDKCTDLIHTFPAKTEDGETTQAHLFLWRERTKTAWENHIEEFKAAFFRSVKEERSKLLYQDNGVVLGSLYVGVCSAWRKMGRVYNWEETITDQGPKFEEYEKTINSFERRYKKDYNHLMILNELYKLCKRQESLVSFLNVVNQNEEKK